jgi:hypothetical protein
VTRDEFIGVLEFTKRRQGRQRGQGRHRHGE